MRRRLWLAVALLCWGLAGIGTAGKAKVYTEWPFDAAEAKRRQAETAKALGVPVEREVDLGNGVKMTLVLIPPGEFLMGTGKSDEQLLREYPKVPLSTFARERPQHRVRITRPFWLGKYEVTQEQWTAVMGGNPSKSKGAKKPVESVSWHDVQGFFAQLNARMLAGHFRLPTEAEWEYGCRAGSATDFSFGDDWRAFHRYGNYCERSCGGDLAWHDRDHTDGHGLLHRRPLRRQQQPQRRDRRDHQGGNDRNRLPHAPRSRACGG
jgi:formylglycine-generating enzyme required for sulfatase activity